MRLNIVDKIQLLPYKTKEGINKDNYANQTLG